MIPNFMNIVNVTTVPKKGSRMILKNERGIFWVAVLTLSVMRWSRTLQVMGGGYYDHGLNKIFPDRFLALSLHISIVLYIRTSHAKGIVSSFKTLDLRAFQKLSPKARKKSASEFIKKKLKKNVGPVTFEGCQTKSGAARAFNFFFKWRWRTYLKSQ